MEIPAPNAASRLRRPTGPKNGPRRISYLWHCRACDYRFEAMAFFDDSDTDPEALAA